LADISILGKHFAFILNPIPGYEPYISPVKAKINVTEALGIRIFINNYYNGMETIKIRRFSINSMNQKNAGIYSVIQQLTLKRVSNTY
jgi:hypothetical protein